MSKPSDQSDATAPYFDEVDQHIDFPKMEKTMLDHWYSNGIVDKYLRKNDSSEKYFSFIDGPITANNPMGVHHGWGRTYKDLWQRYKNMQGFKQRFQNGFDAQGLWVEVEVEKDLGFTSKKDIEDYGVEKFVEKCKARVQKYSGIQTEQSKRLGYFMDWDHSYYTMSDENNYMIWHFLKVCHQNGWLYKGNDSVPWCPRCQTAISQHEILAENYEDVTHKTIYLELPIVGKKREFLLIWTTTPWTLPANIAVAVDEKLEYARVQGDTGDTYWVAKDAVERIFGKDPKIVETQKGKVLVGLNYTTPFDSLPAVLKVAEESGKLFHSVVATDDRIMPISTEEGTGLVHTAVSAGTEDFKLGQKLGLPMIPVIHDDASYMDGLGNFSGKNAKEHPEIILDYLQEEDKKEGVDWVFDIVEYTHRYPRCWRCKAELVWKVTDEWYIAMDKPSEIKGTSDKTLRQRMKDVAKQITWIPEFGLKRELDWLDNMHDWLISKKNRYWGLCLPIWECKSCDYFEVIGGKEELQEKSLDGWEQFEGKSPHKPQIDNIHLKCPQCGKSMSRIEPVGNPWLDAGIVAYSTIKKHNQGEPLYKVDKEAWKNWFPADFITESFPGQFKNWFYSMIAMSTVLEDAPPYKTVLGYGTALAEDGREMHKSWGNSIEFNEGADKMGVDVMRWMYTAQNPSDNLLFGYTVADETRRRVHLKLWNIYRFVITYANASGWKPQKMKPSTHVLDIWMLVRLQEVVNTVTSCLEDFDAYRANHAIEDLINDISNWYVRRSRDRAGQTAEKQIQEDFYSTMYTVLTTLSLILAPFIPFLSEHIWKNLTKGESIHLEKWPETKELTKSDIDLLNEMAFVREVAELAHAKRKDAGVPVRQPLQQLTIRRSTELFENLDYLLIEELNVKLIKTIVDKKFSQFTVDLDMTITPELEEEANTRELIRKIQNERKNKGMHISDTVSVTTEWIPSNPELLNSLKTRASITTLSLGEFSVTKDA